MRLGCNPIALAWDLLWTGGILDDKWVFKPLKKEGM